MKPIKHYAYVNEGLVKNYVDQIPRSRRAKHMRETRKLRLSILGQSYEVSSEIAGPEENFFDQVAALRAELLLQKRLSLQRPLRLEKDRPREGTRPSAPEFVEETFVAHRVDLPVSGSGIVSKLKHLTFWISDPRDSDLDSSLIRDEWDWTGTYLILIETLWQKIDGEPDVDLSGCSALQAVANLASGRPLLSLDRSEPLGRAEALHPMDKLLAAGAIVHEKRRLTSLYRVRYMSNEQLSVLEGKPRRFNDLLGYPLFIVEAPA